MHTLDRGHDRLRGEARGVRTGEETAPEPYSKYSTSDTKYLGTSRKRYPHTMKPHATAATRVMRKRMRTKARPATRRGTRRSRGTPTGPTGATRASPTCSASASVSL